MDADLPEYPFPQPTALDPPPEWERLRTGCPVAEIRLASGDQALLLTRYADVRQVLSDPRFSRQLDADGAARVTAQESGGVFGTEQNSISSAGAAHQRWRRLVGRYFTAKRMAAMQPRIAAMANQLIDDMLTRTEADLVSAYAFPIPVWVICDLLGVPDSDRDRFAYWSDTMLSLTRYTQKEIDEGQLEFGEYLWSHIEAKRANPGEDLISDLVGMDDDELTPLELIGTAQGLLIAGHETTANMIGKMVAMLLADRSRWERLRAGYRTEPDLVRTAVEEALRFDANPGFGMPRYITEEIEVSGVKLAAGSTVINSMAAANRDETAFDAAAELDLTRSPNPHLAFGAGPHSCIGQALARTELQIALTALLDRIPGLRLAGPAADLPRREGLMIGGLERVMVTGFHD
ncbi:putative cytochrome P450 [Actinoplanes missouriensis 431]|uniref:Putative cytochrome P450 n=1 Tax=Actinoplanes missouriensis (strain ATCC 14538 / DSM 43046 / CBS 188.64 / JCM 3121 / NBRC 102363 / NCIMB 12654 / NRRL B-3342 / UNCC 431) TaxID=512565 RepID=I0H382_ACTM4|nr:cytochrome P450 [Actinoplanes missouriensis]BAL87469.1 putative cytochrome P450 [Actinoplanes missouriensis 431]